MSSWVSAADAPPSNDPRKRIAVLIPCHNEALTVAGVIRDFQRELPEATIYVFDNNSQDETVERAREAGATVMFERQQGKGHVVQAMFRRVHADVYLMVDGDGTYPASEARRLIEPVLSGDADMVIGSRLTSENRSEFRAINRFGNRAFLLLLTRIFGVRLTDLLSGYRAFSTSFVAGMPLFGGGFETEAEMTIRALQKRFRIVEVPVDLTQRPPGSHSKIRVVRDGMIILRSILALFRDYKPLAFFGTIGLVLGGIGLIPGAIVTVEFLRTGLVGRMPSAILAVGLELAGLISMVVGLILHTIAQRFRELDYQLQQLIGSRGSRDTHE